MEFTYITMMYSMHAVISRALRLEYDDRDDPIVEIAAPEEYQAENLGQQIGYSMDKPKGDGLLTAVPRRPDPSTASGSSSSGSFIAGPFAGQLLGDYGADVIKVESPGDGDPMRRWGVTLDGDSLWWPAIARNKRSVMLDLREERGARARRGSSPPQCDVVLENFRPGTPRALGPRLRHPLGRQPAARAHPHQRLRPDRAAGRAGRLRQRGRGDGRHPPHHRQPRPAAVAGRDQPRRRAGVGVRRDRHARRRSSRRGERGVGQEVDVAIYEAVAALMESTMADYELGGVVRTRSGSVLPGVSPSNVYPTGDGAEVVVAANADAVFARLCEAMGRPELADDERFATHGAPGDNMARARRAGRRVDGDAAVRRGAGGPRRARRAGRADLHRARHAARPAVPRPGDGAADHRHPGLGGADDRHRPDVHRHAGAIRHAGPGSGEHTDEVLGELLGLDADELADLHASGVTGR